jgi:peptidoglycan DL-endopeptidase CwlO
MTVAGKISAAPLIISLIFLSTQAATADDQTEELSLAVILESVSLKGIPYIWGGSNLKGMDCSGFIYTIYAERVPDLPRRSIDQYRYGTAVTTGKEEPGDLVFFNTEGWSASHVGIYLGDGRFIHAASGEKRNGIIISSLDSPYYRARYLGARRLPVSD